MLGGTLNDFSLWQFFLGTLLITLLSSAVGFKLGLLRSRDPNHEAISCVGTVSAALLGLSAFILGFVFHLSASYHAERRLQVVSEANAIGTTFLRAEFLPAPAQERIRNLLLQYTELQIGATAAADLDPETSRRIKILHNDLWSASVSILGSSNNPVAVGLFLQSLNETIDLNTRRLFIGLQNRIPVPTWVALFLLVSLSTLSLGYLVGLAGFLKKPLVIVPVCLALSIVILIVADMDRPVEGMLQVTQRSMIEVRDFLVFRTRYLEAAR